MTPSGVFCSRCGAGMPAGVSFCGNCGTTIGAGAAPPKADAPRRRAAGTRTLLLAWAMGLIAGFLLGRTIGPPAHLPSNTSGSSAASRAQELEDLRPRAHAAFDSKQFAEAVALYRRAVALDPSELSLLVDLGVAQLALGDEAAARASFKSGLVGSSPHPAAAYNLALLEEGAGKPERARRYYARYLALDPGGSKADEARARLAKMAAAPEARGASTPPAGSAP